MSSWSRGSIDDAVHEAVAAGAQELLGLVEQRRVGKDLQPLTMRLAHQGRRTSVVISGTRCVDAQLRSSRFTLMASTPAALSVVTTARASAAVSGVGRHRPRRACRL